MKTEDLIPTDEICIKYKVERQFIHSLSENGIIKLVVMEKTEYIPCDHLANLEKMMRLYRDLDINMEGISAISHLLDQIKQLKNENRKLRNRLGLYE
ncbi:chaperone modulator CbpM [Gramella sp. AN32]|uniref:Chaperone modulator CbpM n=1 Tax=Christiangramia antarctica TaxID=2058158 RepID=A0ABW5WYL2_9FLAO|nr:chaperone modulator CbpM [Gramella sp. AN32]MCM4155153.1 MerR family transcriptional regulator [Gramella sp. AN32]